MTRKLKSNEYVDEYGYIRKYKYTYENYYHKGVGQVLADTFIWDLEGVVFLTAIMLSIVVFMIKYRWFM